MISVNIDPLAAGAMKRIADRKMAERPIPAAITPSVDGFPLRVIAIFIFSIALMM